MRGIYSNKTEIRHKVFTEIARMAYEDYPLSHIEDLPFETGDEVAVLVNGLGATPLDEQYIVTRKINAILEEKGICGYRYYVGEYATSLEMAGLSISLLKLDDELKELLDYPANTPFFKQY